MSGRPIRCLLMSGLPIPGCFMPGRPMFSRPGWSPPIMPPIIPAMSNFVNPSGTSNNFGSCLPTFTFLSYVIIRFLSFPSLYSRSDLMEIPSFVRQEKPPYFFPSVLVAMVLYLVTFMPFSISSPITVS